MYTVCRNESNRIEAWWKSASEADKVAVIVHDCTDDTEEKLKDLGALVKETHYDTWRFDVGKNDALNWAREIAPDCNILVYTALDEIFDPGWADKVKKAWTDDALQLEYNFVQTHDELGNDLHQTKFNWIHSNEPNWVWKYPIHEALLYIGDCTGRSTPNLFDEVKLNHWPDKTKKREYPDLLKLRYEEYKDHLSLLYLMICYVQNEQYEDGLKLFSEYKTEENTLSPNEAAYLLLLAGACYQNLKDLKTAKETYQNLIKLNIWPGYRDPYINWAFLLSDLDCPFEALILIKEAFAKTHRYFDWTENPTYWNNAELQLAVSCCLNLNETSEALGFVELFKHFNPESSELKEVEEACLKDLLNE